MRPKIRFEVFKRDSFCCQYCGRQTPDVVLEVDHIIPRAEGGEDELENLITACWDCNRGKGATLLDSRAPVLDIETQTDLVNERERQIRAYHEAKREQRERRNTEFEEAWNYWFDIWGETKLARYLTPWENPLRRWVEVLGVADVKDSMDATRARFRWLSANALRYLAGVNRWKIAEQEHRVAICSVCKKRVELESGDNPNDEWIHSSCREVA